MGRGAGHRSEMRDSFPGVLDTLGVDHTYSSLAIPLAITGGPACSHCRKVLTDGATLSSCTYIRTLCITWKIPDLNELTYGTTLDC